MKWLCWLFGHRPKETYLGHGYWKRECRWCGKPELARGPWERLS